MSATISGVSKWNWSYQSVQGVDLFSKKCAEVESMGVVFGGVCEFLGEDLKWGDGGGSGQAEGRGCLSGRAVLRWELAVLFRWITHGKSLYPLRVVLLLRPHPNALSTISQSSVRPQNLDKMSPRSVQPYSISCTTQKNSNEPLPLHTKYFDINRSHILWYSVNEGTSFECGDCPTVTNGRFEMAGVIFQIFIKLG